MCVNGLTERIWSSLRVLFSNPKGQLSQFSSVPQLCPTLQPLGTTGRLKTTDCATKMSAVLQ